MTTEYGTVETPSMNKIIVQRFYDEFLNPSDLDHANELVAYDYVQHDGPRTIRGLEGLQAMMATITGGFPNLNFEIQDMEAEGNKVVARIKISGTNTGMFKDQPPTGRRINVEEKSTFRLNKGKIHEKSSSVDLLGLLNDLVT